MKDCLDEGEKCIIQTTRFVANCLNDVLKVSEYEYIHKGVLGDDEPNKVIENIMYL